MVAGASGGVELCVVVGSAVARAERLAKPCGRASVQVPDGHFGFSKIGQVPLGVACILAHPDRAGVGGASMATPAPAALHANDRKGGGGGPFVFNVGRRSQAEPHGKSTLQVVRFAQEVG